MVNAKYLYKFKLKNLKTKQIGWLKITDPKNFAYTLSYKRRCSGFTDDSDRIIDVVASKLSPECKIIKVDKQLFLMF